MSRVVENTKFNLLENVTQLEDIWQEIGIKEDQKELRSNTVQQHIQGFSFIFYSLKLKDTKY